jgi:hypothetical protein
VEAKGPYHGSCVTWTFVIAYYKSKAIKKIAINMGIQNFALGGTDPEAIYN